MNTTKKINVNFSSLVGLKAELLRKQTEIRDARVKADNQPKVQKPKAKSKKTKDKKPKIEQSYTEIEDAATLKKSRVMLEAKSMLYEKLKKTGCDDETRSYLVDFANKSDESEEEIYHEEDYDDVNSDPEDDWVEYKDCFGRTRKCLRRDLSKMRDRDDLVKREITKEPPENEMRKDETTQPTIIPTIEKEPEIEIMRKKWEEQMERLVDKTDIHYQDVLFDEARAHGVGYYGFSQNEEERARQQENLAKLRKETEQRQRESQEIRDLKSKMELNRLRAATIRQRVRSGLSAELTEAEEEELRARVKSRNSNDTHEEETSPEAIEAAAKRAKSQENRVDNSLVVVEDKIKAFGELLGKRPKWHEMSQEEWVYKRRRDRLGEFAPVYENFRRADRCSPAENRDTRITTRNDNDNDDDDQAKDPVRINSRGPEPTDVWETQGPSYRNKDIKEEKREDEKSEEIAKKDSPIRKSNVDTIEIVEDGNDEDVIGPFPPCSMENFAPATFINSFVPRPMTAAPPMPVSFERTAPPPTIINFSIPPPSIVPQLAKLPLSTDTHIVKAVIESEDSSDSDDSIVIGPVPPPSFNDFSTLPIQNCGPSLIDNEHINTLSDIPLPCTVKFPPTRNYIATSTQSPDVPAASDEKDIFNDPAETNSTGNLDKISAGLKYLRQKFDDTRDS